MNVARAGGVADVDWFAGAVDAAVGYAAVGAF
jgi:hypothetical protein